MPTYLDGILAFHRDRLASDRRSPRDLEAIARGAGEVRDFAGALGQRVPGEISVIAEVKRRSPSKGDLATGLEPAKLAETYERAGAACLSVLTDGPHFGGSPEDLRQARGATKLPVLRKDFTVGLNDVFDARAMGADAVLLIAAALGQGELVELSACVAELGMAPLVEVHDEAELARALEVPEALIGVNQRDLRTFEVDTERAVRVGRAIPAGRLKVAESGVRGADDARRLVAAGFDAILVGEALVTALDPESTLRALRSPGG